MILTQEHHYGDWTKNWPEWIILPGRKHGSTEYPDLLVSPKRDCFGSIAFGSTHTWVQQDTASLEEMQTRTPATTITLRQFIDYVNMMRSDKVYDGQGMQVDTKTRQEILGENLESLTGEFFNASITYQRGPFPFRRREAHLQTYTIKEKVQGFDINHKRDQRTIKRIVIQTDLSEVETRLAGYLKSPNAIDLDVWLKKATPEGLPPRKIRSGNVIYRPPMGFGSTILFRGIGGKSNLLDCGVEHHTQGSFIGVRKVILKP